MVSVNQRYPQFYVGHVEIPASTLPASVAAGYLALLIYRRLARRQALNIEKDALKPEVGTSDDSKKDSIPDEENLNHPPSMDGSPMPSPRTRTWPTKALGAFRCYQSSQNTMQILNSGTLDVDAIRIICLFQLGFVAFAAALQYTGPQPKMMQHHLCLGTAWTACALRELFPVGSDITSGVWTGLTLLVAVSGACAVLPPSITTKQTASRGTPDSETKRMRNLATEGQVNTTQKLKRGVSGSADNALGHIFGVSILVFLFTREFAASHVWSWLFRQNVGVKTFLAASVPLALIGVQRCIQHLQDLGRSRTSSGRSIQALMQRARQRLPGFATGAVVALVFLAEFAAYYYIVAFLCSCLGFRYLILGQRASPPSISSEGGGCGAMLSMWVFAARGLGFDKNIAKPRALFHMAVSTLESIGLVTLIYTGLALAMFASSRP